MNSKGKRSPGEVRERAVRMALEHQDEDDSQWQAICSIADKLGVSREARGGRVGLDSFSEFLGDGSLVRLPVLAFLV